LAHFGNAHDENQHASADDAVFPNDEQSATTRGQYLALSKVW